MMSIGALEKSSDVDENKKWQEVERQEKCCFPSRRCQNPIQVLKVDKFMI